MKQKVIEQFNMVQGIAVDRDEGWKKIISRQFGGNPGRGSSELLQNAIDSYPSTVPLEKRKVDIHTTADTLSVTDYGSGLDRSKLMLLVTLGGTDKDQDPEKIGFFGVGFYSIFNPKLFTDRVEVLTKCEGSIVKLIFHIDHPEQPPRISVEVKTGTIDFSSRITVHFKSSHSVQMCMDSMRSALEYYPCLFMVNGQVFQSIWERARQENFFMFDGRHSRGFIESGRCYDSITVLCKYERVMSLSLSSFVTGGHRIRFDLDDFHSDGIPYLPGLKITINNNILRTTISRDSFYLDYNWNMVKSDLSAALKGFLDRYLDEKSGQDIILANQFIFRDSIRDYVKNPEQDETAPAIVKLTNAQVYPVSGQTKRYSLVELAHSLSPDMPLFFSEYRQNMRWLGGRFRHDLIVTPDTCHIGCGTTDFYDKLFTDVFTDVVNLDTIAADRNKLKNLVDRGIVDENMLSPNVDIVGEKMLSEQERGLLQDVTALVQQEKVLQVIAQNLCLPIRSIRPVFIDVQKTGALISTGVLDEDGAPLSDRIISNFMEDKKMPFREKVDVLLGLAVNHPFIKYLVQSDNRYRAYYSLTFIAHELALSQRLLVPYSQFYHLVKERLAGAMRKALIETVFQENQAA
jgi:hypothetical protein